MKKSWTAPAWAILAVLPMGHSWAQSTMQTLEEPHVSKDMGVVTVTSGVPTSLPTHIPTTTERSTRADIEAQVNATDSEDVLKYFPSLLVRKRYIGDYNHAMLSSRASGTGNSARSAVYADGMPLSNFLGNGISGLSFAPRWNMVTPNEIERVDVMYGPFSAAYPGNSAGAIVDYVTRMPQSFETHARLGYTSHPFQLYGTDTTLRAIQKEIGFGNKSGDWSWWLNLQSSDSHGHPQTFLTKPLSTTAPAAGVPVASGGVLAKDASNNDIYVIGAATQYSTRQDHAKLKLAYDVSSTLRVSYVLGVWQNSSDGRPTSYLRDASTGAPITQGNFQINGQQYSIANGNFTATSEAITHLMQGVSVKTHTQDMWDWEVAASGYDYRSDLKRQSSNTWADAISGTGVGKVSDGSGTGWNNLALRGTWRSQGLRGPHVVDFGYQQDRYKLQYLTSNVAGDWLSGPASTLDSYVGGKTQLQSYYAQDTWRFAPKWMTVLGLRAETWSASNGLTQKSGATSQTWPNRQESYLSPKAALSYLWQDDSLLKAALGRAVRMPTVNELYGATSTANLQYVNDPNLRPEKSWAAEFSYEKAFQNAQWRWTYFQDITRDGLFGQSVADPTNAAKTITTVQNVGKIRTRGVETAWRVQSLGWRGLDLDGSLTYAHSRIVDNSGYITTPGDTLGAMQPNVPQWRATTVATYRLDAQWSTSWAARYSSPQYRTLNNSDVNGFAYMGVSKYFTVDARLRYKVDRHWSMAAGVDNLNNATYWNFHPYPQRTYHAELKYDFQ